MEKEQAQDFLVFVDGVSKGNPGAAGIGVVVKDKESHIFFEESAAIGESTNNQAEYLALIRALIECLFLRARRLEIFSDSQLLVSQMKGEYAVKNLEIRRLHYVASTLAHKFEKVFFHHIPREKNREADRLANLALKKR